MIPRKSTKPQRLTNLKDLATLADLSELKILGDLTTKQIEQADQTAKDYEDMQALATSPELTAITHNQD